MLSIIVLVLKWIGIIVATIIGIVLLLLLCVLFLPLTYGIEGEGQNNINSICGKGSFSWFFGLLRGRFDYAEMKLQWEGYVLWFDIKKFLEEDDFEEDFKEDVLEHSHHDYSKDDALEAEIPTSYKSSEFVDKEVDMKKDETDTKISETKDIKQKKVKKKKKKPQKQKQKRKFNISQTFRNICDKIKMFREKKDKVIEFFYLDIHQYTLKKLKLQGWFLWKHLKPSIFNLDAHIGCEDPSLTGKFLAFASVLYPFYGNTIQIRPEFNEVIYEGKLKIKGYIQIYPFIIVILRLVLDKKVRETYNNIKEFEL